MRSQPSDAAVERWLVDFIRESANPDLLAYGEPLLENGLPAYLWFVRHIMRLGRIYHSRVLDVGSGFGWEAAAISLLGDNDVVGMDVRSTMTVPASERVQQLCAAGAPIRARFITADICDWDGPPGLYDVVVSNEAIEHVRDLNRMFEVCYRALRPGGVLVVSDSSNVLTPRNRKETVAMWQQRDTSWDFVRRLQERSPIENQDVQPYAVIRRRMITEAANQLEGPEVDTLVAATAGMVQPDIDKAVREHLGTGRLPVRPEYSWCRDPITGEYCERLLDPFHLADSVALAGFEPRVHHAIRRWPLRWGNGLPAGRLSRFLFSLRGEFVIVGRKT